MLKYFFNKFRQSELPESLSYAAIVAQARQETFYAKTGVPDTVDGRFDMIVLHTYLLIHRLNLEGGHEAKAYAQKVFDEMFVDMDQSLREMGVGDLSVGKKIKKMARVFYGRAKAYETAFAHGSDVRSELSVCFARNILDDEKALENGGQIADYALAAVNQLSEQPVADILSGKLEFPAPKENF